ncbi:MAG: CRISPR-associated protein Cas4 [Nitrospirae bacterium]|nr:MAG: CRISPR-associated protein Cas4 [Nitrospirota bacterium]
MNVVETQGIYLTPTEVIEYLYCPRFIYFMNCLGIPQHEDQRFIVLKGREVHEQRRTRNPDYVRKKLGCVAKDRDVYLVSDRYRIKGRVDEVLQLQDGTLAPLDYKFTDYKDTVYRTHKFQTILYGMMIEDVYRQPVTRGYVCYVRKGNVVKDVRIGVQERQEAMEIVADILTIIQQGKFPARTSYPIRCRDCCYKNICIK